MAITIPIVTEFKDAGLKKAQGEIDTFTGRIEKKIGKFGMVAAGAGAAIGSFAVKSVMDFKNLALEAGKFADATGIAIEDASRWIEVAGDFDIAGSTVQGAIQKMNKAIADGKPVFEDFGIEVARTKDGIVDANTTFQRAITTIGRIEDPTLRAKAAQEVFGKSYAEIAELMELSATDLATALGEVSDQKIITPQERERAERLRAALDSLKDSGEDLALALGQELAPAFAIAAEAAVGFLNKIRELRQDEFWGPFLRSLPEWLSWYKQQFMDTFGIESGNQLEGHAEAFYTLEEAMGMVESRVSQADYEQINKQLGKVEIAVADVNEAFDRLIGRLNEREAWRNFDEARWEFHQNLVKTEKQTDDFTLALADMVMSLDNIDEEYKVKLLTELDLGGIAAVERYLVLLKAGITIPIRTQIHYSDIRNLMEGRAGGGPVTGGVPYIVGEKGPEVFVPSRSGSIVPNHAMAGVGGMTVNITTSADPNEVVRAIEQYRRRNGTDRI